MTNSVKIEDIKELTVKRYCYCTKLFNFPSCPLLYDSRDCICTLNYTVEKEQQEQFEFLVSYDCQLEQLELKNKPVFRPFKSFCIKKM